MPQQSKQALAISAAQTVASLMLQLKLLHDQVNAFLTTNTDNSYDTYWGAFPTVSTNSNGTAGAYDTSAGTGTVSVTLNSTAITFSQSQSALAGSYMTVTGDTSNGLYLISGGSGTAWVLASPYGGATAAAASWGTSSANNAHSIAVPLGQPLLVARNDLLTSLGCLGNFQSYMTGVSITTQANTPRKFADLLNS